MTAMRRRPETAAYNAYMTSSSRVSVAEARRHLAALLDRAGRGERVEITRRGKPVATLVAADDVRHPGAGDAIRAIMRDLDGEGLTEEELAVLRPRSPDGR